MSRGITSALNTVFTSQSIRPFVAVDLAFSGANVRVWTGLGNITFASTTFVGTGEVLGISPITENGTVQANGMVVSFNGLDLSLVSAALTENYQGRSAIIYLGALNADYTVVADPYVFFKGRMDKMSISDNGESAQIKVSLESRLIDLNRNRVRRFTDVDQQTEFAGDLGFKFVESLQEKSIDWGSVNGFPQSFFKVLTDPTTLITAAVMALVGGPATMAIFLTNMAIYATATAALAALAPKPSMPDLSGYGDFVSQAGSRTQMIKQPAQPRRVVYGTVRVSGVLTYISTTDSDKFLHMIISMACHEIGGFVSYRIDQETVTMSGTIDGSPQGHVTAPARFKSGASVSGSPLVEIHPHTGADDQAADTFLTQRVKEWTATTDSVGGLHILPT